ncbi:uncharacterized protein LOC131637064 [Vicia villosa]|uniref:uncharacterized protein LOC131617190 n=1 Tax=Vicia villosa TaxID=3911 RepID=UPI00273B5522|nr:uncharacterized protein LOC131617190 [Vicia villosa]XP_058763611.1 uncharacterized protein LOC131637064 [Vicia villosa]
MAKSSCIVLLAFFFTTALASLTIREQKYLSECASTIGEYCGTQFYNKVFSHNKTSITRDCCYKILQTGYSCHIRMTVFILETNPDLKNVDRIPYITASDSVFQKCDRVTQPENPKFLSTCVEKIGSACGEEVINKLVQDKDVSKQCCEKVVKTGPSCHTSLAKALLRTPPMKNVDAIQFLKKNKNIYNDCKREE